MTDNTPMPRGSRLARSLLVGGLLLLSPACSPQPSTAPAEPALAPATQPAETTALAVVNGRPIYREAVAGPLFEKYGLAMLLQAVQLELARQQAQQMGVSVSDEEVNAERLRYIRSIIRGGEVSDREAEQVLDDQLKRQGLIRPVFDVWVRTNTYLRKMVEPQVLAQVGNDDNLREAYRIWYGENVRVAHIRVNDLRQAVEIKARLAKGEDFADLARQFSTDRLSRDIGGELPPFSREFADLPQAFKEQAFALRVGEVSDPVLAGDSVHLIKLLERIDPKAVKFEAVKDAVRDRLYDSLMMNAVNNLRETYAAIARQTLRIDDPVLRRQYEQMRQIRTGSAEEIRREMEARREAAASATAPRTTAPATLPSGREAGAQSPERPPATSPGR